MADSIRVEVDKDLEDIVPAFLANRTADVATLSAALGAGDFEAIRILGHTLKGIGGGYGFERITELGAMLEEAAKVQDRPAIATAIAQLSIYLQTVQVVYC